MKRYSLFLLLALVLIGFIHAGYNSADALDRGDGNRSCSSCDDDTDRDGHNDKSSHDHGGNDHGGGGGGGGGGGPTINICTQTVCSIQPAQPSVSAYPSAYVSAHNTGANTHNEAVEGRGHTTRMHMYDACSVASNQGLNHLIPTRTREEFDSWHNATDPTTCCPPVTVSMCGRSQQIGYDNAGVTRNLSWPHATINARCADAPRLGAWGASTTSGGCRVCTTVTTTVQGPCP